MTDLEFQEWFDRQEAIQTAVYAKAGAMRKELSSAFAIMNAEAHKMREHQRK